MNRLTFVLHAAVQQSKPCEFDLETALKGLQAITNIHVPVWDPAKKATQPAEHPAFIAVVTGGSQASCGLVYKEGKQLKFRCGQHFQAEAVQKGLPAPAVIRPQVNNIPAGVLPYLILKALGCARKLEEQEQLKLGISLTKLGAGEMDAAVLGKLSAVAVSVCCRLD